MRSGDRPGLQSCTGWCARNRIKGLGCLDWFLLCCIVPGQNPNERLTRTLLWLGDLPLPVDGILSINA